MHNLQQLSQFWYDEKTCDKIVECIQKTVGPNGTVALISCPTLYKTFKKKAPSISSMSKNLKYIYIIFLIFIFFWLFHFVVKLFEYDHRFNVYGSDYIFYDYNEPLQFDKIFLNYFDLVVVDPPFLSDECLTKSIQTTLCLTKKHVVLCTG